MKKFIKTTLVIILCITSVFSFDAFGIDGEKDIQWYDLDLTETEIEEILALNPQNNASARVSGLIIGHYIGIEREASILNMVAKVTCITDVVKCGFKKIVIQRREDSNDSWSKYFTYEDLYQESSSNIEAKATAIKKGYQYRAVCTFYAKKSLLVTEKIEASSNIITYR